jgi:hypothetical protein
LKQHYLHSSYREKLIEHLLISELLKLSWRSGGCSLEIAKPEVDNKGYDLIAEADGVVRHVQLKASHHGSTTSRQKIHVALAAKPSGCVVWVYFDEEDLSLGPFLSERPDLRVVPKSQFETIDRIEGLYAALFTRPPNQQIRPATAAVS